MMRHAEHHPRRRRDERTPRHSVSRPLAQCVLLMDKLPVPAETGGAASGREAPRAPPRRLSDWEGRLSGNQHPDRRARRTAGALLGAYNRLFLAAGGRARPTVAEIVAEADVGRSTFYEHHGSGDALFLEALKRPFAPLADAAAGRGDPAALTPVLSHFWDQRARARDALAGRLRPRVAQLFADMVEERLGGAVLALPPRLAARTLAEAALAPLTAWLLGEAPAAAADIAAAICRSGEALRHALAMEPAPQ